MSFHPELFWAELENALLIGGPLLVVFAMVALIKVWRSR